MPRCNLTLKQKSQMIELSSELNTEQLAKRFRVHPTTVTRTLKKQEKILHQAARVNPNFKTVQTNFKSEQHDALVLDYVRLQQEANTPITVNDICDKAVEYANGLGRQIKSKRAWWRRFKVRCNIVKSKVVKNSLGVKAQRTVDDEDGAQQERQAKPASMSKKRTDLNKRTKRANDRKKASKVPTETTAAPVLASGDKNQGENDEGCRESTELMSSEKSSQIAPAIAILEPLKAAES